MDNMTLLINDATTTELKHRWEEAFGEYPSRYASKDFLRRNLAYHYQKLAQGGLSKKAQKALGQFYLAFKENPEFRPKASQPSLKPGTQLVRQWKGIGHTVTVKLGHYEYQGKEYKSLSAIAHLITGTRWSGPKFFGLRQNKAGV